MTRIRKIALSIVVTLFIVTLGAAYQYYYLEEREEYERAITSHYQEVYKERPNSDKLRHLTTLALDRYGPTELYRQENDYHELFAETFRET